MKSNFARIILLLGSFMFGLNAEIALHEFGHALAIWLTNGSISYISLNPFSKSIVYYSSCPNYPRFTQWGGVLFSIIIIFIGVCSYQKRQSQYLAPVYMTLILGLIMNGLYLIFDSVLLKGGDATDLIKLGTPKLLIIFLGIILLCSGILLGSVSVNLLGIKNNLSIKKRILILIPCVLFYFILMSFFRIISNLKLIGFLYFSSGLLLTIIIAILSKFINFFFKFFSESNCSESISLKPALASFAVGIIVTIINLI